MDARKYAICNVAGDGKLFNKNNFHIDKFRIIDMSAGAVRLETPAILIPGNEVKLKMRLKSNPIEVHLEIQGIVTAEIYKGYEIQFLNLPEGVIKEIDELMRETCNIA